MDDKYKIPREKIAQLETLLKVSEIDALLILSREGSDSLLPFLIGEDAIHPAAAFFLKEGDHLILTSRVDMENYLPSGIFKEVLTYDRSLSENFLTVLDQIDPNKLALNWSETDPVADGLTYGLYLMLEEMIGKERLNKLEVSSEHLIRELRSVKTETEIAHLQRGIQITNDIYDEVFARIRCGMSEIEIGELFVEGMKKRDVINGLGKPYDYPIICLVRAGLSHRRPGPTQSIPGDILIIDFSVNYKGYISDIARTAYFLKPSETSPPSEIQHAFDTAHQAITTAIDFISPGKLGWEVDAVARQVVEAGGFPTVRHSVGHPIGRECHDSGTAIAPYRGDDKAPCNRPIGLNEVYAIEPTVIQDGGLPCMLVEENVVIRPDGAEVLSRRQDALYLIDHED